MSKLLKFYIKAQSEGIKEGIKYYLNREKVRDKFWEVLSKIKMGMIFKVDHLIFSEKTVPPAEKKIYFYSPVWGEAFVALFFNYAIPSILQEGNIPKLKKLGYQHEIFIYTKPESKVFFDKFSKELVELEKHVQVHFVIHEGYQKNDRHKLLIDTWLAFIETNVTDNVIGISLCPEFFFGNNSLFNLIKLNEGKGDFLAVTFPRVSRESAQSCKIFNQVKRKNSCIENAHLVDLAFQNAHSTLKYSFDHLDENTTYGGLAIRKLPENTFSVIHNLAPIILFRFIKEDFNFFKKNKNYSLIDKVWPRLLFKQNRLKIVTHSDLCFCVELTPDQQHQAVPKSNLLNNDKWQIREKRHLQQYTFNSIICIWKGQQEN